MRNGESGFTLIELLVVMVIMAILMSIAAPKLFQRTERAKEVVYEHNLKTLRQSIDYYYQDHSAGPDGLEELVSQGYLRELPLDPFTNSRNAWIVENNSNGEIIDVRSKEK